MQIKTKHKEHKYESKEIKQTLKCVQKENLNLVAQKESQECKFKRKSLEFKAAISRENYQRTEVAMLEDIQNQKAQNKRTNLNQFDDMLMEIDNLKSEIKNLNTENTELRNLLAECQFNETITVSDEDKRAFLPELQTCVYELLSNHVSSSKVSKVIEEVLKLAGKKVNHLPSTSSVQNMNLQRLTLSKKQLGDLVDDGYVSLYTDETSKYIRDHDGHYFTLGLRDLVRKSGKDSLETFNEILNDIDNRANDTVN